jgi:hypothetical protein
MRYWLVLGLSLLLAACSGGGSNNMPAEPLVPWGSFRHDVGNSGAFGQLNLNNGNVTMLCSVVQQGGVTQCPSVLPAVNATITQSSPTVDRDGNILLGTDQGLASFGPDGHLRWKFLGYETTTQTPHKSGCAPCDPSPDSPNCFLVGRLSSSPTVTPGNTIVFGTEGTDGTPGHLFAIQQANGTFTCDWIFPNDPNNGLDFSSSAATQISNFDFTLSSAYIGADDGQLRAFNSDGTVRWSFENRADAGPITSTPALDANNNVYITTADGLVTAVNFSGSQVWQSPVGIASNESPLYPSPGVSTAIYAIGAGGTVFAISPSSQPVVAPKWQFIPTASDGSPIPIIGSPAFISQSFPVGVIDNSDTVVYVVDAQGTAYGLRTLDGQPYPVQRCTGGTPPAFASTPTTSCKTDSCQPPTTCDVASGRCRLPTPEGADAPYEEAADTYAPPAQAANDFDPSAETPSAPPTPTPLPACTRDTCVANMRGMCVPSPAVISIPGAPVAITTSPVISGDFFMVVGTSDGRVCARAFDPPYGVVPGYNRSPPNKVWGKLVCNSALTMECTANSDCPDGGACIPSGCIQLNADNNPTLSSPVIGLNGVIYVTTADGLYAIK